MPLDVDSYRRPTRENEQRGLDLLGDAIRIARRWRGLSQRTLSAHSGVSQSTISKLERGLAPGTSARRLAPLILVLGGATFGPIPRPMAGIDATDLD
jgi:DNA-binding transcriptional regulator YiaG